MTPEVAHPIEKRARPLALELFGIKDEAARRNVMRARLQHVFDDLTCLYGFTDAAATEYCNVIVARALDIEDAGHPVTVVERDLHPGLAEFLEMGADKITQMLQ